MASLFFYFYTNFGVWFLDAFGMYPKTLTGLIECYVMGLPFLRLNLLGNLLFIPSTFILSELLCGMIFRWKKLSPGLKSFFFTR